MFSSYWNPVKAETLVSVQGSLFNSNKCSPNAVLLLQKDANSVSLVVRLEDESANLQAPLDGLQFSASDSSFFFTIANEVFEFRLDSSSHDKFLSIFSQHGQVTRVESKKSDKQEHVKPEPTIKPEPPTIKPEPTFVDLTDSPPPERSEPVLKTPEKAKSPKRPDPTKVVSPTFVQQALRGTVLERGQGILSAYSPDGKTNLVVGQETEIILSQISKFEFAVCVMEGSSVLTEWTLSEEDVSLQWRDSDYSVTWVTLIGDRHQQLGFAFSSLVSYKSFKTAYTSNLLQAKRKESVKVDNEDASWVEGGLSAMFQAIRIDEDEDELVSSESIEVDDEGTEESSDDDEGALRNEPVMKTPKKTHVTNSLLSVGRSRTDRSYVVRGDQLGAFSPAKGKMNFINTSHINSPSGKVPFSPSHAMLHKRDEQLLFLHPTEKKKVYCMDLERGQVIEEWATEGLATAKILPETKDSQVQGRETFLGINNAGFFVMDSRAKDKVVRAFQYKNASTTHFSCAATTQDGHMAVGTKMGEVRLFNQSSLAKGTKNYIEQTAPRAKTKLVGYGDPVIGIDVTRDGKFVLSTCATYILLTRVGDTELKKNGFSSSFKNHPFRLALQPTDVIKVGGKVSFTPAKFNVVGTETFILCSTGNWLITWDFEELISRGAKASASVPYSMKRFEDSVVADDFSSENKGDIVLSLPEDVVVHSTKLSKK